MAEPWEDPREGEGWKSDEDVEAELVKALEEHERYQRELKAAVADMGRALLSALGALEDALQRIQAITLVAGVAVGEIRDTVAGLPRQLDPDDEEGDDDGDL